MTDNATKREKRRFGFLSSSSSNNANRGETNSPKHEPLSPILKGYKECINVTRNVSIAARNSLSCASNTSNGTNSTISISNGNRTANHTDEKKEEDSSMMGSMKSRLSCTGKTPKTANTTAAMRESHAHATSTSGPASSDADKLPGIFILMDQLNWPRVAQRAKKYKKECKVSAYVKRKQSAEETNKPSLGRGCSDASTDVAGSYISRSTNGTRANHTGKNSFDPETHVKCKALHHACHRLRRVHGHIRKCIVEALKMEKAGYQLRSPRLQTRSFNSSSNGQSFDSSDGGDIYRLSSHSFDTFSSAHSKSMDVQDDANGEWDDPWIEACKAILVIIEQNPDAAGMRESRHGCLPLHLAVFAMGPTPDVSSVEEKYAPVVQPVDVRHAGTSRLQRNQQTTFVIPEELPPPRPLAPTRRGRSNSSVESCDGMRSLDDFSANMAQELPMSFGRENSGGSISNASGLSSMNTSSRDEDLSLTLERLEMQLRSSPKSKLSKMDEEKMLLSARNLFSSDRSIPRPPPLNSLNADSYRNSSMGSQASTCSNSVMSCASTIHPSPITSSLKYRQFDLKKYIANEARREEYTLRVLSALLDAFPRAVKMDSEGGRLPLHTAIAGKATLQVIETLTRQFPQACTYRNNENSLPLHLVACYGVSDPNVAPMLLKVYPEASWGRNRWERIPYQEAKLAAGENGREHQLALVKALVKPPDYWRLDGQNSMATGYLGKDFSGNIDHLLQGEFRGSHDRNGLNVPQDNRRIDIFQLIQERQWDTIVDNIDILQGQARHCIECEVQGGYTAKVSALYLACEQQPTYEVLDALVNACPGSTTWRKIPGGELPIHAACTWGASKSVVGFLLAASPDSARIRDGNHNLALHAACYSGVSRGIIESLLFTNPKAASARNILGLVPRDIVLRLSHGNRREILDLIEDVGLEILKKKRQQESERQIEERKQSQVENDEVRKKAEWAIPGKAPTKRSVFGFSRKENRIESIEEEQQSIKERRMNITRSPPPEENIEVELAEDSNDGNMLWV